jgi:hypothetical protein
MEKVQLHVTEMTKTSKTIAVLQIIQDRQFTPQKKIVIKHIKVITTNILIAPNIHVNMRHTTDLKQSIFIQQD